MCCKYRPLEPFKSFTNLFGTGNVGTIIRSAAGAACTAVVSSPVTASFWLSTTLRGSAAANYL